MTGRRTASALFAALSFACAKGTPGSSGGVFASVESGGRVSAPAVSTATVPQGPTPAQAQQCPLETPLLCPGGLCCHAGDSCTADAGCQTTGRSVNCPAGTVPCGQACIPGSCTQGGCKGSGQSCTLAASECPWNEVPCNGGIWTPTGSANGYCCPAGVSCGPLANRECGQGSGPPPLDGHACASGPDAGWCPSGYACLTDGTAPVCVPTGGGGQPTQAGNCAVTCKGVCCAEYDTGSGPSCGADGQCSFPSWPGQTAACAAGQQLCGSAGCCAAPDVCGQGCGCPASAPAACGDGCCPDGDGCFDGGCTSCPAGWPVACGGICCLAGASCEGNLCGCPPAEAPCGGGTCCAAGAFCDSQGQCARCPADAPVECGDLCCGASQQCLQCSGESAPTCHDQPCPAAGGGGSGGSNTTVCPSSVDHWEPKCGKCCNDGWTCCVSQLSGQLDCVQPNWCQ